MRRQDAARAAIWAGMLLLLLVTLFPFYWMVNTSLKPQSEVFQSPPTFVSANWTLAGYAL
jgi:multiple sugar transport system permease protein